MILNFLYIFGLNGDQFRDLSGCLHHSLCYQLPTPVGKFYLEDQKVSLVGIARMLTDWSPGELFTQVVEYGFSAYNIHCFGQYTDLVPLSSA